jgi:hypothetical protein
MNALASAIFCHSPPDRQQDLPRGSGYCASRSRFHWGLKLYLVSSGDGMPIMWCLAHPQLDEGEVVAVLLDHNHHLIRDGRVMRTITEGLRPLTSASRINHPGHLRR